MPYDNARRARAARETRARVVVAAHALLLERGWAGTTIRAVAAAGQVSPETVYKGFGGKAGLLKAVYDQALAGDDEAVAMGDRPLFAALRQAETPGQAARAYATIAAHVAEQAGPLLRIVLSSRGAEPDLQAFADQTRTERLVGVRRVVGAWQQRGWLRPERDLEETADLVWTLVSPEVHELLHSRGWTLEAYRDWVAEALLISVLVP